MKYFRILTVAAAVALFGSCLNDPTEGPTSPQGGQPVVIECEIDNPGQGRLDTDFGLQKVQFEDGDIISLEVMRRPIYQSEPLLPDYEYRGQAEYYLNNFHLTYRDVKDEDGNPTGEGQWLFERDPGVRIVHEPGYRYDYYACYPVTNPGIFDPQMREYAISGSAVGMNNNDLMWARNVDADYNESKIKLHFNHLTSMIEVRQMGFGQNASVKLVYDGDIKLNAMFNVGTGTLTLGGDTTAIPDQNQVGGFQIIEDKVGGEAAFTARTNGRYMLYLPPQELDYDLNPRIEICSDPSNQTDENTRVFNFKRPEDPTQKLKFEAGKSQFKVYEPDIAPELMHVPNTILVNRRVTTYIQTAPVGKAYAMWLYDKNLNGNREPQDMVKELFGDLELRMIWTDTPNFTELVTVKLDDARKGANARLNVQPLVSTPTEANAVYGLWIGGQLRWSWHIWVSNASDPVAKPASVNGLTFMNQNLGARPTLFIGGARGLLYQWGRKDPFPGAAVVETGSEEGGWDFTLYQPVYNAEGVQINGEYMPGTEPVEPDPSNPTDPDPDEPTVDPVPNPAYTVGVEVKALADVTEAVLEPAVFSSNWAPSAANLWDVPFTEDPADRKSPYDPCPVGWRVAKAQTDYPWYLAGAGSALSDYTSKNWDNGIVFDKADFNMGYYPMTSYRQAGDGAFDAASRTSSIWHGGETGNLWTVSASGVGNSADQTLGNGRAVRCVRDINDTEFWLNK